MIAALFFIALAAVAGATQWRTRRHHGVIQGGRLARDIGVAAALLLLATEGSRFWIDWAWWRSLGQTPTFWQYLRIRWLPQTVLAVVAAAVLMTVFALARRHIVRHASAAAARTRLFGWLGYLISGLAGILISVNLIDPWIIALFLGAQPTGAYTDPIFQKDLAFYLFRLPFYEMAFEWVAGLAIAGLVIAAVTILAGSSAERMAELRARVTAQMEGRGWAGSSSEGRRPAPPASIAGLVRAAAVLLLVIFAVAQFFARYALLYSSHRFLTGADYVDVRLGIPLLWVQIGGALALALVIAVARRRPRPAADRHWGASQAHAWEEALAPWVPTNAPRWLPPMVVGVFLVLAIAPALVQAAVRSVYVQPNELTLERPYITDHIQATRMAFNLEQTSHEEAFNPKQTDTLDLTQFPDTTGNLRLWDQGPFQDDATQLQALRPYYAFPHV